MELDTTHWYFIGTDCVKVPCVYHDLLHDGDCAPVPEGAS